MSQEHIESLRTHSLPDNQARPETPVYSESARSHVEGLHKHSQRQAEASGLIAAAPSGRRELAIKAEEDRRNAWIAANPDKKLLHYYAEKNAAAEAAKLPTAADLDAVAEEQKAAEATGDSNATGQ